MDGVHAWLIAYDIRCPRRLKRMHYHLSKRALFVQESLAVLRCDLETLETLIDALGAHFDPKTDDLRAWRVDWPDGAWITGPDARGSLLMAQTPRRRQPATPARAAQSLLARLRDLIGA